MGFVFSLAFSRKGNVISFGRERLFQLNSWSVFWDRKIVICQCYGWFNFYVNIITWLQIRQLYATTIELVISDPALHKHIFLLIIIGISFNSVWFPKPWVWHIIEIHPPYKIDFESSITNSEIQQRLLMGKTETDENTMLISSTK